MAKRILPEETSGNTQASLIPSDNTGVKLDFLPKKREIYDPTQEIMPGGATNPDNRQGVRPGDDLMFDAALLAVGLRNPFGTKAIGGAGKEIIGKEAAIKVVSADVVDGAIANGVSEGTHVVYLGYNKGVVEYIGITGRDASVRFGEHFSSGTAKSLLEYRIFPNAVNLTKIEARILEQKLINQYGLNNLLNIRNSIAPKYWWQYGILP